MASVYSNWARFSDKWTRYSVTQNEKFETGNDTKSENTILVIPGNPGNDQFYNDFTVAIANLWKKDSRIFTIAHLNHIPLPKGLARIDGAQLSRKFKF